MPSLVTGGMRAVEESAERPGLKAGKVCCVTCGAEEGQGLGVQTGEGHHGRWGAVEELHVPRALERSAGPVFRELGFFPRRWCGGSSRSLLGLIYIWESGFC